MTTDVNRPLRALGLIYTLTSSPAPSSSALLADQLFEHLTKAGVQCQMVR